MAILCLELVREHLESGSVHHLRGGQVCSESEYSQRRVVFSMELPHWHRS